LEYWKLNTFKYPVLSLMARRYLAIPASSAPVERTFSIGNNVITKSRNRLDPKTVKRTVLLKSWKIKELKELEDNFRNFTLLKEEEEEL
jgi:hypothetical protein